MIDGAAPRMKAEHPIVIDRARRKLPAGGAWEALDPISRGCVQLLPAGHSPATQAVAVMAELQRLAALDAGWQWRQAAVISREWQYLHRVRSYCELHGIPVQMADEEPPPFWHLRETRQLVEWLRGRTSRLVGHATIDEWLRQQPDGPWWTLIRQAIGEYALENGAAELPTDQYLEWLAECGRGARRRQDGLLLLTAHRAKGLEFEHVVVLDGGWTHRSSSREDPDAPRRLYYVAMTRARSSLTLARLAETHPILDTPAQDPAFLKRSPVSLPAPEPALARQYLRVTLKQVDIGFAGRHTPSNPIHQRISRLRPGDLIQPVQKDGHWFLVDANTDIVGRLARHFHWPPHMSFEKGQVIAVVTRSKQDTPEDYRDSVRCEHWEIVLPELVLRPIDHS